MPPIDPEKLKDRLVYRAPQQASVNTSALRFKRPTNAQIRKANAPIAPKLEPLVRIPSTFYITVFYLYVVCEILS